MVEHNRAIHSVVIRSWWWQNTREEMHLFFFFLPFLVALCSATLEHYGSPHVNSYSRTFGHYPGKPNQFSSSEYQEKKSNCYDEFRKPQKCVPEFGNAAYGRYVEASNVCGMSRIQQYCLQSGFGSRRSCVQCDANVREHRHPASYLTDFHNDNNQTWWQSETMAVHDFPQQINVTLSLGKAYDITYVRLFFRSPRPESFAIYKRSSPDDEWEPYQLYSSSCRDTYNRPDSTYIPKDDESRAICTSEFSDISPLTGGTVAFATLENRPSARNFENSPELQEWVTATDIKIVLDNLNTFGDELFGDRTVRQFYFYAITDLAVGGRCKCNGHASKCVVSNGHHQETNACVCEHRTQGIDCQECEYFYNDAPWQMATSTDAHECKTCNCNGFSNECYFDQDLYDRTGHGGHCRNCRSNRAGPNCERCEDNYYEREGDGACIACNCHRIGSRDLQCDVEGKCQCKPGVVGDKCDRCDANHYEFNSQGCKPCNCYPYGSYKNRPSCNPSDGICDCKRNVEGQQCDSCKHDFFNLDEENEFGCTPCFCYTHSSVCSSASGYSKATTESRFVRGSERWTAWEKTGSDASVSFDSSSQNIAVSTGGGKTIYFSAPRRFLGNQRSSYNRDFSFTLRVGELGPQIGPMDVILESGENKVSRAIFGHGNPLPTTENQVFTFRLHEAGDFGWSPRLSSRNFMGLLSNLTAIKIRGTYTYYGKGFLDDLKLETTRQGQFGDPATWVETCSCLEGYVGQFCESCSPGYRHNPPNGGPFAHCIPCDCNNHATNCDSETGQCICQHNTAGGQCGQCAKGFYGNAHQGTPDDCQACPCPNGGACLLLPDKSVYCWECPEGYAGHRCELCTDGYFGDPRGQAGAPRLCEKCDCNGNVDSNAVSNCNRTTGECLKCIYNTGEFFCNQCLPGFYGDALALPKGDCAPCRCNFYGTQAEKYGPPVCDQISGECSCKSNVMDRTCDKCRSGFWNLVSGEGCEACNCDPVGSVDGACDVTTGHCVCRPGVTGQQCDTCERHHYGFSTEGCKPCECDGIGSVSLQCDATGQCKCRDNVEGRRCERCRENTYDKQVGCRDCPPCYTLVLDAVSIHRERLAELERLLKDITTNPTILNDSAFKAALDKIMVDVTSLWTDAQEAAKSGGEATVEQHLTDLENRINKVRDLLNNIENLHEHGVRLSAEGKSNVGQAKSLIDRAREALRDAQLFLDVEGNRALDKAVDRSNQFGQQSARMSEIARDARLLADSHGEDAKVITQIAYDARNTSHDANALARKAIADQNNITQIINGLEQKMTSLSSRHKDVLYEATTSLTKADVIYKEALNMTTEAISIAVPPLDASGLRQQAEELEEEARRLKDEVNRLMNGRHELIIDLQEQIIRTKKLQEKGLEQQKKTADLLARVYNAKEEAEAAVRKADKTLEEAQDTLTTLEGFDQKVQESRGAAEEALNRINEIEELIVKAEGLTRDAQEALQGAESDAKQARDIAQRAKETAQSASEQAGQVRSEAEKTEDQASALKAQANRVAHRVEETSETLLTYEEQAASDLDLVVKAQVSANSAKSKADQVSQEVEEAYEIVAEIFHFLDNALHLNTTELDLLEIRLDEAYRKYEASDIERTTLELSKSHRTQERQISYYEDEIRLLSIEVNNIQEIKESLPDGCFRQTRIET